MENTLLQGQLPLPYWKLLEEYKIYLRGDKKIFFSNQGKMSKCCCDAPFSISPKVLKAHPQLPTGYGGR